MAIGTTIKVSLDSRAVQRGLSSIQSSFASLGKMGLSLVGTFAKLGALIGVGGAGAGFVAMAKGASDTAANFEQMTNNFRMFTGSLEGARSIMEDLREIDMVSNLDIATLGKGAEMLMAYGMNAKDATDSVRRLAMIAGSDAQKFERLALAFGQTTTAARLTGEELRQYVQSGWSPMQHIMQKTGETMEQFRKRLEDKKVTLQEVREALVAATEGNGKFAKAFELGATTFAAAVSRMKTQWMLLQNEFGKGLNEGLKAAFDGATAIIPQFAEIGRKLGKILGSSISDAVKGDYDKFKAIGTLIGDTIGAALVASMKYAWENGIQEIKNGAKNIWNELNKNAADEMKDPFGTWTRPFIPANGVGIQGQAGAATAVSPRTFSELFNEEMMKRGIRDQFDRIGAWNTGGPASGTSLDGSQWEKTSVRTMYRDSDGDFVRLVKVMEKVEQNTRDGSKM